MPLLAAATMIALSARAGTLPITLKGTGAPAVDLTYRGHPIDRDQAIDLKSEGVDLSTLDPIANDVWGPESLPATSPENQPDSMGVVWRFPAEGATVLFDSAMKTSQALSLSRVLSSEGTQAQPFQLMISLDAHAALVRAALLRRLGYPIPTPRYYRRLTVKFKDVAARDSFLDDMVLNTKNARTRWLVAGSENVPEATLQDVVLEPAQIDIPMYHWAIVPGTSIRDRRVVRSLILPLVLLDVTESINLYSWELGKILDNNILLTRPLAENFAGTTYDDVRWIARKIARLSRDELREVVSLGKYPDDVAALLLEKLVARRDQMVQLLGLSRELPSHERKLPYDVHLNHGAVKRGKLTQAEYPGYALRFSYGDPDSPLRGSEVGRFLLLEGISNAMSAGAGELNKLLTIKSATDVTNDHQTSLMNQFNQHMQLHPNEPYSAPVGAWAGPIGGFGITANRDVVTGTYFGSESKVQLVDNLTVQASLGFFMGIDGLPQIIPSVTGNLVVQRNYLHIRPIADMKEAMKKNWADLLVPKFMVHMAGLVNANGVLDDQAKVDEKLKSFLNGLQPGEMIMVIDSVVTGITGQVTIPIPILMNPALTQFNPSLGVSIGTQPTMLRRTTFTRTADGVQVYLQNAKVLQWEAEFDFNWWINVLKLQHQSKYGEGRTRAYLLDKEPDSPTERKRLAIALHSLLLSNSSEILEDDFKHYEINHRMNTAINSAKLLWWKWAGIEEKHRVSISPPDRPDRKRTLFSDRVVRTRGIDGYGFVSDILSAATQGVATLNNAAATYNPANSFLGSARWVVTRTEAETTPGGDFSPVSVIEHHFGGWFLSKPSLDRMLDAVELKARALNLDRPLIRRDEFATANKLEMYEVLSTLIVYQSGLDKISKLAFEPGTIVEVVDAMEQIQGKGELERWCHAPGRRFEDALFRVDSVSEVDGNIKYKYRCVMPWMKKLLGFRDKFRKQGGWPRNLEERVTWTNQIIGMLEKYLDFAKLLKWLGGDNFFFQIKVSGFRTHDENGDTQYVSDSVGSFDQKHGAGVFNDFATKYGILTSELTANYLSEGF